ncbi:MAG: hypothetical protein ABI051_09500 [Vicinamibacterales bacterium]
MQTLQTRLRAAAVLMLATALVTATAVTVWAHEVTYQGTVLAVEAGRIEVNSIDATSKKELPVWFAVNKTTKVKRGAQVLTYAAAQITKGERIVIIVDHDAETKMLAAEIRLASKG